MKAQCNTHGEYLADPIQYHKGIKETCPKCNPAIQVYMPYKLSKIIDRINIKYPVDTQLTVKDIEVIRGELLDLQNGICPLCNKSITKPVVDHWHTRKNNGNGKVRMALCATCNSMLGVIENHLPRYLINYSDAPTWLDNAARYIQNSTTNLIHPTEKPKVKIGKTEFNILMKKYLEKYPTKSILKYPQNGKANARLQSIIKEFNNE